MNPLMMDSTCVQKMLKEPSIVVEIKKKQPSGK